MSQSVCVFSTLGIYLVPGDHLEVYIVVDMILFWHGCSWILTNKLISCGWCLTPPSHHTVYSCWILVFEAEVMGCGLSWWTTEDTQCHDFPWVPILDFSFCFKRRQCWKAQLLWRTPAFTPQTQSTLRMLFDMSTQLPAYFGHCWIMESF